MGTFEGERSATRKERLRPVQLLAAIAAAFFPVAAHAQLVLAIDFSRVSEPVTISWQGTEVTVQPRSGDDNFVELSAAIRVPGHESIIVHDGVGPSPSFERFVSIGKLSSADAAPTVLLESFTGGAHCCATMKAVVPVAGKLKVLEFDPIDGEPSGGFPKDLNGDGTADFVRQDDRFRYAFASGAGSYSPPVIFNIYKGHLVDVSAEPSYRPIWEAFARTTRAACADRGNDDRNGACIAYLAAAARMGQYEQAFTETQKMATNQPAMGFPKGCSVQASLGDCPPGRQVQFYTFGDAARWFLKATGYID